MGMRRRLPEKNRDLKRYVLRRRALQVIGYLIWLGMFGVGAWLYNDSHQTYPPHRRIVGWRLAVWMLVAAVVGFFLFRIWRFFTLRNLEGVVVHSGLSHSYTSSADPGAANPLDYDFRLNTYLVIRDAKGRKHRIRFEQKPGFYLYYYAGTHVCRFSGLPYPIRNPRRSCAPERGLEKKHSHDDLSAGVLCVACGNLNNRDCNQPCGRCGHSLIQAEDVWNDFEKQETEEGKKK